MENTDCDFDKYIKTCINFIISETWDLQNIQEEIFRARKPLKTFEDSLFPNKYKSLTLENTKFVFDLIIEDFARWTVKKEILNVFNNCLNQMTEAERYEVSHNLLRRKKYNLYYLYKLIDLLSVYGDYDFQALLIKIIFRTFKKGTYLINQLFPESEDLQNKFLEITIENIDGSIRKFLKCLNQRSQNIFSVKCLAISLGSMECVVNNSDLWIDFNLIDKIVSWYTNIEALISEKDRAINNTFYNLIFLFERDVKNVKIQRNLCKTIVVTFTLQESCVSYHEEFQHIIHGAKTLQISLDYSPEAEYLIRSILPTIYKSKYEPTLNKRRKLSLLMNPYVKMSTRTIPKDEIINISSSSSKSDIHSISEKLLYDEDQIKMRNSISDFTTIHTHILKQRDLNVKVPSDSTIYIKSKTDVLNSEGTKEHDFDELKVPFESEEQLLTMARTFDTIKSVLNSRTKRKSVSSTTSTKSNIFQNSSEKKCIGKNIYTAFNSNKNENVLNLTNTSTIITDTTSHVILHKIQATRNKRKVDKTKKRKIHSSEDSTNSREADSVKFCENNMSYNCNLNKSKYFDKKIKSNQLLKSNVIKKHKDKVDVTKNIKPKRKITKKNYETRLQLNNILSKENLDHKNNVYETMKFTQKKNIKPRKTKKSFNVDEMSRDSFNFNSILVSPYQCRAADEEVASDLSSPLTRKRKNALPISVSSDTENEMYETVANNILNPHVKIPPFSLPKNSLVGKIVSSTNWGRSDTQNKEKSFNIDHMRQDSIIVVPSAESENLPRQCIAIDEKIASSLQSPLSKKSGNSRPIIESTSIEDEIYTIPEINGITPLPLLKNALTNILEDKAVLPSECEISNSKNIIDKPNILCDTNVESLPIPYEEKSVENIDVPCGLELKTNHLGVTQSSKVWSRSAILGNKQVKLSSKDFVGKYLLIICYNTDISVFESIHSEINQFSEKIDDFNNIGATVLICLKGPNLNFSEWRNQFKYQEFLQELKVPLIFDFDEYFRSTNFEVYLGNVKSEMKILLLVSDQGDVIYKTIFSIFDEVDVVNSLKLLSHFQMRRMMT